MFKRPSSGGGEPPAKEEKKDPIPRHIPSSSITLNFVTRTWELIKPGKLYYLPLEQTPQFMFDPAMIQQYNKFKELWHTMEIHTPSAKLSNLIMLQNEMKVQSGTPANNAIFTQVCYTQTYEPKGQKQYFKLGNLTNVNDPLSFKEITYKLKPSSPSKSQLIELNGFSDFNSLAVLGAKANTTAGFIPYGSVKQKDGLLLDPYIAPNTTATALVLASGNMKPEDSTDNYIPPANILTYSKNQDKINFYKYGDCINIPIHTNIEGMHLAKHASNDFLNDQFFTVKEGDDELTYKAQFAWPSRNRPFLNRGNYYDVNSDPITAGKAFKPLKHTFLCMPPIYSNTDALIGQTCSALLEQHISVTFHMNQAVFFANEDDDAQQVNQDNQILLRRNIYPTPVKIKPPKPPINGQNEKSVFCRKGKLICKNDPTNKDQKCYGNDFSSLSDFIDSLQPGEFEELFTFQGKRPGPCPGDIMTSTYITTNSVRHGETFQRIWEKWIDGVNYTWLCFKISGAIIEDNKYVYWVNSSGKPIVTRPVTSIYQDYIHLHKEKFLELFFAKTGSACDETYLASPRDVVYDETATVFFV